MKKIGKSTEDNTTKYGYINTEGKLVIDCQYDFTDEFSEGLARVQKNGKYGFIDKQGNVVIDFIYDEANNFSDGLALVRQGEEWGKNDKGKKVANKGVWKYIDKEGKIVLEDE